MSTATAPAYVGNVTLLPVDDLEPSPANNRVNRTAEIESLAESIREQGLLQLPIVRVHPSKEGKYELVCGERRWRACKKLFKKMPVDIRKLNDSEAHDITITENLQREDLSPMEEAAGVRTLLDDGRSIEEVADRLGKSHKWVARRAKLTELAECWVDALRDPDDKCCLSMWSGAHLELVARFEQHIQNEIFHSMFDQHLQYGWDMDRYGKMSLADLRESVEGYLMNLDSVPWKLEDADLVPAAGACAICQKRTGCQQNLFDEVAKKGKVIDRCTDRECYSKKTVAYVEQQSAKLRESNPDLIYGFGDYGTSLFPEDHPLAVNALKYYEYSNCKKSDAGAQQMLVIDGPGVGRVRWVKKQSYSSGGSSAARDGKPKPLAERRAALEKRRTIWVLKKLLGVLVDEMEHPNLITGKSPCDVMALAMIWHTTPYMEAVEDGCGYTYDDKQKWSDYRKWAEKDLGSDDMAVELMRCLIPAWKHDLNGQTNMNSPDLNNARKICECIGMDIDTLIEQAKDAIKEPKSWANLNEDGTPKSKSVSKPGKGSGRKAAKKVVKKKASRSKKGTA